MESDLSTHFCKMSGLQSKKDTCDELTWKAGKGPLPSTPKAAREGLRDTFTAAASATAAWRDPPVSSATRVQTKYGIPRRGILCSLSQRTVPTPATWMNLEDVSREIRPPQGDTCCLIPLTCNVYDRQSHRDQKEHGGYQRLGEGMGGYCLANTELRFCRMKKVPWTDGGDGSPAACTY